MRTGEEEFVVAELLVTGPDGESRQFEVFRNGKRTGSGSLTSHRGEVRTRLLLPPPGQGAAHYEVRPASSGDPWPKNNQASSWVTGVGGASVLLISPWPDDPVSEILSSAGFRIRHQRDPAALSIGDLAGISAVLIHGFGAGQINPEFLRSLDFFVRQTSRGLVIFGGPNSFGSGGYFESALDLLLPVSMELKEEHRKLSLSMGILLNRSGSMTSFTKDGTSKLDLANRGAARVVELLGPSDAIAVFAVDSTAKRVVSLRRIGFQSAQIQALIRQVEGGSGGIYIYEALQAGWREIKDTPGRKHLLLFVNASDSEEPGNYKQLLAEMRTANATVSVIGLGTENDVDSKLLKDIAERGGGRIFFTNNAAELPSVFAQETATVARATFLDQPTPTVALGGWGEISPVKIDWLPDVEGYKLCYAQADATILLMTKHKYHAPLVAHWHQGLDRVAAVTFPLAGDCSKSARSWPLLSRFCTTLTTWLAGEQEIPGAGLRLRVVGGDLVVEFFHDETWGERGATSPPKLFYHSSADLSVCNRPLEPTEPGRFEARLPFGTAEWVRGTVVIGQESLEFGPVSPGLNAEWNANPSVRERVRELALASNGRLQMILALPGKRRVSRAIVA